MIICFGLFLLVSFAGYLTNLIFIIPFIIIIALILKKINRFIRDWSKNRIKNKVNTPPTICENDNYYDDLLRVYSSESIPLSPTKQQCIIRNQQNNNIYVNRNFTDHPLFVMSYFFYSCVELFWKKK